MIVEGGMEAEKREKRNISEIACGFESAHFLMMKSKWAFIAFSMARMESLFHVSVFFVLFCTVLLCQRKPKVIAILIKFNMRRLMESCNGFQDAVSANSDNDC